MAIRIDPSALSESRPRQYVLRFLFGGACTAIAGAIAKYYGPAIGGLFLAFPAIFPAAASLIESDERRRKAKIGRDGRRRGKDAAALDAFGAVLGCLGLIGFAVVLWRGVTKLSHGWVLALALLTWSLAAFASYLIRAHWPRPRVRERG